MTKKHKDRLLSTAIRVTRVVDLKPDREPAPFEITDANGDVAVKWFNKRMRQVLEVLADAPLYAASPVRLSDMVLLLREEGVDIETHMFDGDPGTGTGRYGIYELVSRVRRLDDEELAA